MNANDSAFPAFNSTETYKTGLTKRELFAAMALARITDFVTDAMTQEQAARIAVECADALIAELNKEQK